METRPRIELQLSPVDKTLEVASKFIVIFLWAFTIYELLKLPMIIPSHFNAAGKVDEYGSKAGVFILPAVATLVYFLLTYINKFPHYFMYKSGLTQENAVQQYTRATSVFRILKLVILLLFSLTAVFTYAITVGSNNHA